MSSYVLRREVNTNEGDMNTSPRPRHPSTTSTVIYQYLGHEPFATYQNKVKALCQEIWPSLKPEAFTVERRAGREENRIIKITTDFSRKIEPRWLRCLNGALMFAGYEEWVDPPKRGQFVIRIPRKESPWFNYEVGINEWVAEETGIPAPLTVKFQRLQNNKIGKPYVIQRFIRGRPLENTFYDLDYNQRVLIARDLGRAMVTMIQPEASSPAPGFLDTETYMKNGWTKNNVQPLELDVPFRGVYQNPAHARAFPSKQQTTLMFLKSQISRQREYDLIRGYRGDFWRGAEQVVEHLDDLEWFDDDRYCLTHLDLGPHNIICGKHPHTGNLTVRLIEDWDLAIFAPMWLSLTPPSWLWTPEGEEPDEAKANNFQTDRDLQAIKDAFEENFDETGWAYMYTPPSRIARVICRLAILSINSKEDYMALHHALSEWNELYPDRKVRPLWDSLDPYANDVVPPAELE
ncbi:hypothetical protein BDV96DRAFT_651799 [Lophiotrema nucula]|uniref:Aminoglycoside phosphotransferase domain-containing protein n=1 Tax=Lophiotrema nucula TaxID=690887 RepID=A0A6A5YQK2_9PLEO|nr:hypothetical protein BDV96DRAFT_651799 [Lophiotrema nucula]